ncbi:hypothetical protein [Prochlorococcus sp. MIT 1223]|uniref:hypothetical protein n=1 Tax=Prochlorococcus sp. MIT 1223 TaxID=3096217 RepID=UPI002A750EBC|nr:hypothetical protein [Prochlorococcus sp. MIT 1223]
MSIVIGCLAFLSEVVIKPSIPNTLRLKNNCIEASKTRELSKKDMKLKNELPSIEGAP